MRMREDACSSFWGSRCFPGYSTSSSGSGGFGPEPGMETGKKLSLRRAFRTMSSATPFWIPLMRPPMPDRSRVESDSSKRGVTSSTSKTIGRWRQVPLLISHSSQPRSPFGPPRRGVRNQSDRTESFLHPTLVMLISRTGPSSDEVHSIWASKRDFRKYVSHILIPASKTETTNPRTPRTPATIEPSFADDPAASTCGV